MITFVPVGGLANRMRAIHSAISLAENDEVRICWFKDKGLNCFFHHLFQPISLSNVKLKEANLWDKILLDRPRRKNFHIPKLYQTLWFDACLYEHQTSANHIDFKQWKLSHNYIYMASFNQFYQPSYKLSDIFIPNNEIQQKIEIACVSHSAHTIGIHIRRGDHKIAIQKSPICLFIEAMEKAIEQEEKTNFYLATDSESDKKLLTEKFGNRIITSPYPAERNSIEGMKNAVVDLYALSRTHTILGSYYSSFSEIAAELGGCKLHTLTL